MGLGFRGLGFLGFSDFRVFRGLGHLGFGDRVHQGFEGHACLGGCPSCGCNTWSTVGEESCCWGIDIHGQARVGSHKYIIVQNPHHPRLCQRAEVNDVGISVHLRTACKRLNWVGGRGIYS